MVSRETRIVIQGSSKGTDTGMRASERSTHADKKTDVKQ